MMEILRTNLCKRLLIFHMLLIVGVLYRKYLNTEDKNQISLSKRWNLFLYAMRKISD